LPKYGRQQIEKLGASTSPALPSILNALKLDLKELLQQLRYAFLGENYTLLVIVSSSLTGDKEENYCMCYKITKQRLGGKLLI